ncbi:unnamed protein product, partial [Discosporangium mesarthrocarpum]
MPARTLLLVRTQLTAGALFSMRPVPYQDLNYGFPGGSGWGCLRQYPKFDFSSSRPRRATFLRGGGSGLGLGDGDDDTHQDDGESLLEQGSLVPKPPGIPLRFDQQDATREESPPQEDPQSRLQKTDSDPSITLTPNSWDGRPGDAVGLGTVDCPSADSPGQTGIAEDAPLPASDQPTHDRGALNTGMLDGHMLALVMERSTALGSGRGTVTYSILPDGRMDVRGESSWGKRRKVVQRSPPFMSPGMPPRGVSTKLDAGGSSQASGRLLMKCRELAGMASAEFWIVVAAMGGWAARATTGARAAIMSTFLPVGYPDTVSPEYLRFQCWNIVQDLSTYLRGVLATQAVLEGMGVGRAGSSSLAATLQWMARDGASMLGGLLFTSLASGNFGVNVKSWRLFADASNDVGMTLEMVAPAWGGGNRFVELVCLASVFKASCGVAAGATGAAIAEHWALEGNIADVGAK